MEDQSHIIAVKAWLSSEEPVVAGPPTATDATIPRPCRACGEPLPFNRKTFHNKVCQGTWMGKQNAADSRGER